MTYVEFPLKRSPFYKKRNVDSKDKDIKGRVSLEVFNELETYFNVHYGDKSKGVREVLLDFLNNLCQERQYFRNLHAIMLLPKSLNPDELNEKSEIIGLVDVKDNFSNPALFLGGASYNNRLKLIHTLEEFNERNYMFLGLSELDKSVLFDIDKKTQDDFESLKKRLSELYPGIDLDDAYFVMFNLNNYLDIEDKGSFHSSSSTYLHEGALVLLKDFNENVCARLTWEHTHEVLSLDVEFYDISYYLTYMVRDLSNNGFAMKDLNFGETLSREESLKRKIESYDSQIKHIERMKAMAQARLDEELEKNS